MRQKAFMIRERTPIGIVFYAIYLYLLGLSLRQTSRALQALGFARSHEAVRQWVHRLAGRAEKLVMSERADAAIVVSRCERCWQTGMALDRHRARA